MSVTAVWYGSMRTCRVARAVGVTPRCCRPPRRPVPPASRRRSLTAGVVEPEPSFSPRMASSEIPPRSRWRTSTLTALRFRAGMLVMIAWNRHPSTSSSSSWALPSAPARWRRTTSRSALSSEGDGGLGDLASEPPLVSFGAFPFRVRVGRQAFDRPQDPGVLGGGDREPRLVAYAGVDDLFGVAGRVDPHPPPVVTLCAEARKVGW